MSAPIADRDYAGEYFEARKAVRSGGPVRDAAAERRAAKIEGDAHRAGVRLDVIEIDEQARLALYGTPEQQAAATARYAS